MGQTEPTEAPTGESGETFGELPGESIGEPTDGPMDAPADAPLIDSGSLVMPEQDPDKPDA